MHVFGQQPVSIATVQQAEVAEADQRARELGVSGVPFFIFDGKTAVSGAQEPEALLQAIAQARATA